MRLRRWDLAKAVFSSRNVNTMVMEIQWLRPVQLGGQGDSGGHSWVVCGYNKGTNLWQFLMNMGWGGGSAGGDGSPAGPYQTLYTALVSAANGTTLIFSNHRRSRWYEEGP